MTTRWADLPVIRDTESGIAAIEREQMTKPRPLEIEEPALHQPSSAHHHHATNEIYQRETCSIDEITLQSIKFIQYCRQLRDLIQNAKQQVEAMKSGELKTCSFPPVPPVPSFQEHVLKQRMLKPIPFLQKDTESAFVRGIGPIPPEISLVSCKRLLKRSVAAVCAHASFDSTMESCLDTLSDVLHNYLEQMSHQLRAAVDDDALCVEDGASGFSDVICKVFYEMGIGSPAILHNYYQSRVVDYHTRLILISQQLHQEYKVIVQPDGAKSTSGQTLISWKERSMGDIQFPSTDENDEGSYCDHILPMDNLDATANHDLDSVVAVDEDNSNSGRVQTRCRQTKHDHEDRQSTA